MDSVFRAAVTYAFLLVLFRVAGKRTMAEMTTFDFVVLLIISEATQQAMLDNDNSMTNAFLLVGTLVGIDIGLSLIKQRFKTAEKYLDDVPLMLIEDGRLQQEHLDKARVDTDDILEAARERRGLERLDQIKYAVLERNGNISIIPKPEVAGR